MRTRCNRFQAFREFRGFGRFRGWDSRGWGFTLIELLVVISILALLLALMLPALGGARARALTVTCASDTKQHGFAIAVYCAEYREYLPICITPAGTTPRLNHWTPGWGGWGWNYYAVLWLYAPNMDLFICPAIARDFKRLYQGTMDVNDVEYLDSNDNGTQDPGEISGEFLWWGGYGINESLSYITSVRLSQLKAPGQVLVESECGLYNLEPGVWRSPIAVTTAYYVPGAHDAAAPGASGYRGLEATEGRHPNKQVNVLYGDMHVNPVSARKQRDLFASDPFWDNIP